MRTSSSVIDVIRRNVCERGAEGTYQFLADGGAAGCTLSFSELDARARAVAVALLEKARPGAHVLLLYPPGEQFVTGFLGTLYAGMVAIPVYPPDPLRLDRTLPRLRAVVRDSGADIVLSTELVRQFTSDLFDQAGELARLPWLVTEQAVQRDADAWRQPPSDPDAIALLQYTSGSTGTPRGVVVTHRNLLSNGRVIADNFGLTAADVNVSWLPFYHDMGLLGGVLQPLLSGLSTILISPLDFLRRPLLWLQTIAGHGATASGGPNFAFDLCVRKSTEAERAALDLSTWRVAFCGAEQVRHATLTRFTEAFAVSGFDPAALLPCYGLAEATLFVAGAGRGNGAHHDRFDRQALEKGRAETSPDGDHLVSSGRIATGHHMAVVDPDTCTSVAAGLVGELWVSGSSVAAGYHGDATATAGTFAAKLPGDPRTYLRTGDLGFVHGEQIYVTGRLKEMMVVRGRNLYAHDLEETAVAASTWARPGCAAAFSVVTDEGEQPVVLQEVAAGTPADALPQIADAIAAAVRHEYGVALLDVVLLGARTLAKTSSGKVQRLAGLAAYRGGVLEGELYRRSASAAGSGEGEDALAFASPAELRALPEEQRLDVLERTLSRAGRRGSGLPPATTVAELNLDSLAAVELAFAIEEQLSVVVDPSLLLRPMTLRELAVDVDARLRQPSGPPAAPAPARISRNLGALSAGQESLLFLRDLDGPDSWQNVSVAVRLAGPVDLDALSAAVRYMGARHPILTARFGTDGSRRWQESDPSRPFTLDVVELTHRSADELRARVDDCALGPFAVEEGEVARVRLFTGIGAPVLVLAQHHVITDFWSVVTFLDELATAYGHLLLGTEPQLPPATGYEEFVRWQQDYERSPQRQVDERYWLDLLSGEVQAPALPYQNGTPRPGITRQRVIVPPDVLGDLEQLAGDCETTLFSVLMAAFGILVGAHSGEGEFLVGATTNGRPGARFRHTLGYFSNTVPVRIDLGYSPTVADLVSATGRQLRASLEHQHFSYRRLVELLRTRTGGSAAVNTAVVYERPHNSLGNDATSVIFGAGADSAPLKELTLEPFPVGDIATQFDIALYVVPAGDGLLVQMLVRSDRFAPGFAEEFTGQYLDLLGRLAPARADAPSALRPAGTAASLQRADVPARTEPGAASVLDLLERTADRTPDATAIETAGRTLSYAAVHGAANRLAHELRTQGLGPEDAVGLCMRRSADLVIAMLAVMKAGACFVPLDPDLPETRLTDMVADARCVRILCNAATADLAARLGTALRADDIDGTRARPAAEPPVPGITGDNLAYTIFTSGSTGRPKGVQIAHGSLLSFQLSFLDAFALTPDDRVLQFAPLTFDACIEEIFATWITGATLVLRDDAVLDAPGRFWAWCAEQRLTVVDLPTAFFHVLVGALDDGVRVPPSLRTILIAGEAAHPDKLSRWFAADREHVRLYNRWGTTEATVCSTVALLQPASGQGALPRDVPVGADMTDAVVHVLDSALRPVPDGVVGEAYIGGPGVGRGYASAPRNTAERFVPDPFTARPGRRLYATGDLVRRAADGELRYLGRADQQVKVRGYRIELGEIDVALRHHPAVRDAAVVTSLTAGHADETELIAAVTGDVGTEALRDWLATRLPGYMVPGRLLALDRIPLTPHGKVDAAALREHARSAAHSAQTAVLSGTESRLLALWREVLGVTAVGLDDDFYSLGGQSLRAAGLNTLVRKEFGVEPPLRMFFESVTVRAQAARIDGLLADRAPTGQPASVQPAAPPQPAEPCLSLGQRRLWFLDRLAPGSSAYVVPGVLRMHGTLDRAALHDALSAIVARHPALRTGFHDQDGSPVVVQHSAATCPLDLIDRTRTPQDRREADLADLAAEYARRRFELDARSLMRAALVEFAADEHALLLSFHHIVSDGRSMEIVAGDLAESYTRRMHGKDATLPEPARHYAQWARQESAQLATETGQRGLDFWARHLSGAPQALDLPVDRPRPALQTFTGARVPLAVGPDDAASLRGLAQDRRATVFMVLAAGLAAALSRLSGQRQVVLGVPDANRPADGGYDDVVGFFVNTLPLCFAAPTDDTARQLVDRSRSTVLDGLAWGWVPFSAVVEAVGQDRDPSRSPLFQVILDVRSGALPQPAMPGLRVDTTPLYNGTAKTDLNFEITDDGGSLTGWLEYNTDVFEPSTARHIAWLFGQTLHAMARRPDERISIPGAAATLDRIPAEVPSDGAHATFWAQFERTAAARADAVAIEGDERSLTYAALRREVEQVARFVADRFGVRSGDVVAVAVEPSVAAVVAALAVQRCGGVYLPLDPAYPDERRAYMLADSGARGMVTRDLVEEALAAPPLEKPLPAQVPDAAAYLIYTSGSTGRPKGALIPHRALANHTAAQARAFGIDADSRMLQFASLSFDASIWEIFATLAAGGTLITVSHEHALVGEALADTLQARDVTICMLVPSVIASLPDRPLPRLTTLVSAGEACRAEAVERWQPGRRFMNGYGPTECTVMTTVADCLSGRPVSLGALLPNATGYILDAGLRPTVTGAVGELYIGGAGVALGYHGRPALTAASFVPDPFTQVPGARMYRTGDLVRLRPDGTLDYCGRTDSQLKLRGFRIEPGETEAVLRAVRGVASVVVQALDAVLVAYVEATDAADRADLTPAALERVCAAALPAPLVPAAFVVRDRLPRLPSGKLDTRRLGRPERDDYANAAFTELQTDTEYTIARIWAEILEVGTIGGGDDFFALGGHSLLATVVTARVGEELGRDIPLRALFEAPELRAYAARCDATQARGPARPPAADPGDDGPAPLSVMQERLWVLEELDRGTEEHTFGGRYHLAGAVRLTGTLDEDALRRAVARLVERHTTLRTVFAATDGVLSQHVLDTVEIAIERSEPAGVSLSERIADAHEIVAHEAVVPMDLTAGPLLRVRLLPLGPDDTVLALTLHHIVGDGWSVEILKRDLAHYYSAETGHTPDTPLPPLDATYQQFARRQRDTLASGALDASIAYWTEQLQGLPALALPLARRGTARPSAVGGNRARAHITAPLRAGVERLAAALGGTEFMVLAAALQVTLGRLAGQRDFAIGVPVAGRRSRDVEELIGFFINSVVLRADLTGNPSFAQLLQRVRTTSLEAYEHQDVPFEMVVDKLAPERDLDSTPLFQVYLNLLNLPPRAAGLHGLRTDPFSVPDIGQKFDLTFYVSPADGQFTVDLVYAADRYDHTVMDELLAQWIRVLEQAVADSDRAIDTLDLHTPRARRQLPEVTEPLDDGWYGPVVAHFERWAAREPARIAISEDEQQLSYGDLAWATAALSGVLQQQSVAKGDVVAVYGERCAALVWAVLAVLRTGASFTILDPSYPAQRLVDCLAVARPSAFLQLERAGAVPLALETALHDMSLRCRLELPARLADARHLVSESTQLADAVPVQRDDCAYLAFTSGSTGTPKGIRGAHGSLTHFLPWMVQTFELRDSDRYSMLSGISHDPLHREMFTPLCTGATICIPSQADMETPGRLAQWFRSRRISVGHFTPPMARLFAQLSSAPGTLPLLKRVFFVGDALTSRDVQAITAMAGSVSCVNLYGSTETQRAVGYYVVPPDDGTHPEDQGVTYPLGRGMKDVQLLVVNESGGHAGIGEKGEVVVRSPHLALGYAGDDALTAARFTPNPFTGDPADRVYRTGDLGTYGPEGMVLPLGRADSQVKIRGYRVETDEIQHVLCAAPGVRDALVVTREPAGQETSLVAYVIERDTGAVSSNEVKAYLRARLPEYMVPAFVVPLDAFPLTPNRKIDRAALPEPAMSAADRDDDTAVPLTPTEELVAGVWQDVLGSPRVLAEDNFFNLGGHSLMATQVVSRIRRLFGCDIALRMLFEKQTVRQLAAHVDSLATGTAPPPVTRVPRTADLAASYGQERLWVLDRLEGDTCAYNSVTVVRLHGALDEQELAATLDDLVGRHEVLRTRLVMTDGAVRQVIEDAGAVSIPLDVVDLTGEDTGDQQERTQECVERAARIRFDLGRAPLERATLIRISAEEHIFVLTVHHVIGDGWGLHILIRDFAALYRARHEGTAVALPELDLGYADWAAWQRTRVEQGDYQAQLDFWHEVLTRPAPLLQFPAQRARPAVMSGRGITIRRVIPRGLVDAVRHVGRTHNATLFMTLLAAFSVQLHRYTGARDIAIGTPVSTRSVEIEDVVGFFVNTLVFRNQLSNTDSFAELLDRVRTTTLAGYARQDVPFDQVVDMLQPSRDLSLSPLFQVMFVLHNQPHSEIDLGDLTLERLHPPGTTAKFDLSLDLAEDSAGLHATLELNADLFDAGTGEQLLDHFETLLAGIADAPQRPIGALELSPPAEAEARRMLCTGPEPYTPHTPAASLEHWARRTPDAPAVIDGDTVWTFRALRDHVAGLAVRLSALVTGGEPAVVVCGRRSAGHIAAALAAGEIGATYVPVSPALPDRRIAAMIGRLGECVVVTDAEQAPRIDALLAAASDEPPRLVLDEAAVSERPLGARGTHPRERAYVIFTSGTTGEPKGVVIEQAGMLNHLELKARSLDVTQGDVIAQTASQSFDISVWQMLVGVLRGAATVISDDDTSRDAGRLLALVRDHGVTVLQLVPAMIGALLDRVGPGDLHGLRHLVATGEELPADLCARWLRRFPGIPLINAYGPAECSDDTHQAVLSEPTPPGSPVPIGSPMAGVRGHVIDEDGRLVPFGVTGELAIGGPVVGRGYLGDPRATAERFVPDPFGDVPGARLYRTGDRARLLRDGRLEFLGRLDDQLKMRGYRIEAGEVESALRALDGVREAAVVVQHTDQGEPSLLACVAGSRRDPAAMAGALVEHLPRYMIPSGYVFTDRLPRNANGKIDRAALLRDDLVVERVRRTYEAPAGPTEHLVASLFGDLLGADRVGVHDDFFALGGHSLLATRLVAELAARTDVELPLRTVFDRPTVRGVATAVDELQLTSLSAAERQELRALLDGVTDDEARALLAADKESDQEGAV